MKAIRKFLRKGGTWATGLFNSLRYSRYYDQGSEEPTTVLTDYMHEREAQRRLLRARIWHTQDKFEQAFERVRLSARASRQRRLQQQLQQSCTQDSRSFAESRQ